MFAFGEAVLDVLSLPDLVASKKTQCDKDWPMIRRVAEVNYMSNQKSPTPEHVSFWLRELRTAELLLDVVRARPDEARKFSDQRPLLATITPENVESGTLANSLRAEEEVERSVDTNYWRPFKERLTQLGREARHFK